MYVTEGMKAYRVRWKDMHRNLNWYLDEAESKEEVLSGAEEFIKKQYMASFTVIGLEVYGKKGWEKINISPKWYTGR